MKEEFKRLALSYKDTEESPHFDKTSFRIKKKIFATLNEKENRATVYLSQTDQYIFCLTDKTIVYPVPNKWGLQGWTHIDLTKVSKKLLAQILRSAYNEVASKGKSKKGEKNN